jgi:hypothetical protein
MMKWIVISSNNAFRCVKMENGEWRRQNSNLDRIPNQRSTKTGKELFFWCHVDDDVMGPSVQPARPVWLSLVRNMTV